MPQPSSPAPETPSSLFGGLTPGGLANFLDTLRAERTGGILLLAGAVVALVWANSPWAASYTALSDTVVGPAALHLDLSLASWATDGLLAIFFFVVGVELKREIVAGELRRFRTAVVPVVAAVGGMTAPALLYVLVNATAEGGALRGWAVPTATDIAFAVAVLSVVGRSLPASLRAFLLTLAVVDDLLGIVIIAVVYTDGLHLVWLAASLVAVGLFAALVRVRRPGVAGHAALVVIAVAAWALMHASGVHATIAGVLLGLTAPAVARAGEEHSVAERLEHRWRPVSAGFAVPVFALFAAGVPLSGGALAAAVSDPVAQGVALGLVVGKPVGILAATWLVARFTRATLAPELHWRDVGAVGLLAGIGFTVSLLIGELAFGAGSPHDEHLKVAILLASTTAAVLGGVALAARDRQHRSRQEAAGTR
ncbi:Na+/H+ antiporter NhaA [Cellulomonas pakistanensis]|uniref:Na(+)/H(+) antiporter NhaA n=1 Tax=Cellulomonas pakistanensis TaxID=992287 RepID=A0A919PCM9_9CELL|nr:Na+/H+ antiporter NhaA [Cellulomonas pakistanensis]GIG37293.1 Na(+)/H(+) antiporter NhaA [Cellulomonas pakistanensis]